MTQLEEYREQMARLRARRTLYKEQLSRERDLYRRSELKRKVRTYSTMIRELQEQIDHLDPPEQRAGRRGASASRHADVGRLDYDFFSRSTQACADLAGRTREQREQEEYVEMGTSSRQLLEWTAQAAGRLKPTQRRYMDEYYNEGWSMARIAQEHGVQVSTVSKVIKRGVAQMQEWVSSRHLAADCADGEGGFDWEKFLGQVPSMTIRQRQLMLLALTGEPKYQYELSDKLELDPSTVCRNLSRARRTLDQLGAAGEPVSRPRVRWADGDKWTLALDTGMPLHFYYRYCYRGQRINGLTRYRYEMALRLAAGVPAEETAREMGLKVRTVRSAYAALRHVSLPLRAPEGTIGARLSPEELVAMERVVTSRADP